MNPQIIEEMLDELDPIFQNTDASAGIVRLLKEKGIVKDDELAPYLEQAATAGSIKWRATRLRLARLLESTVKSIEEELTEKQKKALEEARAAEQHPRQSRETPQSSKIAEDQEKKPRNQDSSATAPAKPTAVAGPDQDQGSPGSAGKHSEVQQPQHQPSHETKPGRADAETGDNAKEA